MLSSCFTLLVTATLGVAPTPDSAQTPRAVIQAVTSAVNAGSADAAARHWRERVTRDSADRLAGLALATLSRLTYQYSDAEQRYTALASHQERTADVIRAYALLGLAWQADTRGFPLQADSLFPLARRAAQIARDSTAEAEALLGWAITRVSAAGVVAGLGLLERAHALIPARETGLRAEYFMRRSVLRAVSGQPGAAADAELARQLAQTSNDPRAEARALRALALETRLRGHERAAIALLDTVAQIQRRVNDHSALAETLLRQRDALVARGDLYRARQLSFEAAAEAKRSHNTIAYRSVILGLGAYSLIVRDYPSADAYLSRTIDLSRAEGDSTMMILARHYRAELYLAINAIDKAQREREAVLRYHQMMGDRREEFESLVNLVGLYLQSGNPELAAFTLRDAEVLAQHEPEWRNSLAMNQGAVAMAQQDWNGAEQAFTRALTTLDSTQHLPRYVVRTHLAKLYAQRGDLTRAAQELLNAEHIVDRWRASLRDAELRKMVLQAGWSSYLDRSSGAAATLAILATQGDAVQALDLAERQRARELADRVLRAGALRQDSTPAQRTKNVHNRNTGPLAANVRDTSASVWHTVVPDRETVLVEYVTGAQGTPTTAFVVARDTRGAITVRARLLPSADTLSPRIARFVALMEAGGDASTLARQLGRDVLDPVLDILGTDAQRITRMVIIPAGPLSRLPFDALRLSDGAYAVTRFAISFAPSGRVLAALRARGAGRHNARDAQQAVRMLAIGDPALTGNQTIGASHDSSAADLAAFQPVTASLRDLPPLRGAAREARRVAQYAAAADVLVGAQATRNAFANAALSSYRVLHFATHAIVDDRSDARTALMLAPDDGNDGSVLPGDIAALPLNADLVVLSACRSAAGVVVDGEGVQGLTTAFLEAGTSAVVSSQWRIGDDATAQLMEHFYDGLAQQLSVGDALRQAKLQAIARGAPPRDWAAMTVVGDSWVQVPLQHPPGAARWPWILGAVALAVALLAVGRRLVRRTAPRPS